MRLNNFLRDVTRRQRAALERHGMLLIADVAVEHISLAEARDHLSIDAFGSPSPESAWDDWLEAQIPAAREYCEQYLGRSLAAKTLEYATHTFPTHAAATPPGLAFQLPFGPVQEVVSVTYTDADGTPQTVDAATYELDPYSTPTLLALVYGEVWPTALASTNSVKVRYIAGYNLADDTPRPFPLPKLARSAMLLMLAHLFANREATTEGTILELPLGVQALLDFLPRERLGLA
jgi:uncharacterized phiE125 gp8 family phage protein